MRKYMEVQKKRIEIDKWEKGCDVHCDPGQPYIFDWIKYNATWFRAAWEKSLCKNCILCYECGHEVKDNCTKFKTLNSVRP